MARTCKTSGRIEGPTPPVVPGAAPALAKAAFGGLMRLASPKTNFIDFWHPTVILLTNMIWKVVTLLAHKQMPCSSRPFKPWGQVLEKCNLAVS